MNITALRAFVFKSVTTLVAAVGLCVLVITVFSTVPAVAASKPCKILSFKIWKHKKVDEAKAIVTELRRETKKVSNAKTVDEEEDRDALARKLSQADLNLGVARELSANDYFVLYVVPQFKDNNDALVEAAKNLSAKDMADILRAYQKRLQPVEVFGAKAGSVGFDSPAL